MLDELEDEDDVFDDEVLSEAELGAADNDLLLEKGSDKGKREVIVKHLCVWDCGFQQSEVLPF